MNRFNLHSQHDERSGSTTEKPGSRTCPCRYDAVPKVKSKCTESNLRLCAVNRKSHKASILLFSKANQKKKKKKKCRKMCVPKFICWCLAAATIVRFTLKSSPLIPPISYASNFLIFPPRATSWLLSSFDVVLVVIFPRIATAQSLLRCTTDSYQT